MNSREHIRSEQLPIVLFTDCSKDGKQNDQSMDVKETSEKMGNINSVRVKTKSERILYADSQTDRQTDVDLQLV